MIISTAGQLGELLDKASDIVPTSFWKYHLLALYIFNHALSIIIVITNTLTNAYMHSKTGGRTFSKSLALQLFSDVMVIIYEV